MKRISPLWLILAALAGGLAFSRLENLLQKQPVPVVQTLQEETFVPIEKGEIYAVIATGLGRKTSYEDTISNALIAQRALIQKGAKPEHIKLLLDNPGNRVPIPYDINSEQPSAGKVIKAIEDIQSTEKDKVYVILAGDGIEDHSVISFSDKSMLESSEFRETVSRNKHRQLFVIAESYLSGGYGSGQQRMENAFYASFSGSRYFRKFLEKFLEDSVWNSFIYIKGKYADPSSRYLPEASIFDERGARWTYPRMKRNGTEIGWEWNNAETALFLEAARQFSQERDATELSQEK
ncbi:MAG: hypothetical protein Q7S06_03395 [Nanoarchaeota archaeon]|nr:hypothetical protein [Nanoarchaeota archaeon]